MTIASYLNPVAIALISGLCGLILSCVLLVMHMHAPHIAGTRAWLAGSVAMSIGLCSNAAQDIIDNPWVIVLSGTLLIAGNGLIWLGARQHRGAKGGERFLLGGVLLFFGAMVWVAVTAPQPGLRFMLFSAFGALFCALALLELIGDASLGTKNAKRAAIAALGAMALLLVARFVSALVLPVPQSATTPTPMNNLTLLLGSFVVLTVLLSVIILVIAALVAEIRSHSRTDYLTGATNRQGFVADAPGWLAALNGQRAFAIRIDIKDLKLINGLAGHEQGDEVLRVAAQCALDLLPPNALMARWGGDEFMAFIPGVAAAQRFELEYPRAFTLTAFRLPAFAGAHAPARRITPSVSLRTAEHLGSLHATLGLNSVPNGALAALRAGR